MESTTRDYRGNRPILRAMRLVGALAILAVGAIHLQQYIGADYEVIPTIGPLFLLNAIGAAIVGVPLLLPLGRFLAARKAHAATAVLAIGALAIAIGSLVGLFISESTGLFGFTEHGYGPPIMVAIITEAATLLLLSPVAAIELVQAFSVNERRRRGRDTSFAGPRHPRATPLPK